MLRRTLLAAARPSPSNGAAEKGRAAVQSVFGWYPVQGGEFLGNFLAGHNLFIQDIPQKFDTRHARHFSLVEGLTIVPLFSLSMVHYFSTFCQYPNRAKLAPPLLTELGKKTVLQNEWMQVLQKKSPMDVLGWRIAVMTMQIAIFPLCLLVSCAAPQLVHATMKFTNHILATKYECISNTGPGFVSANVTQCKQAEDWHQQQMLMPTDFGVAVVTLLIILRPGELFYSAFNRRMKFLLTVPPSLATCSLRGAILAEAVRGIVPAPASHAGVGASLGLGGSALSSHSVAAATALTRSGERDGEDGGAPSFFCCSDPPGYRLSSGSGTIHLLEQCYLAERAQMGGTSADARPASYPEPSGLSEDDFLRWLARERRVLVHAGGQSRRLPGYGPGAGKALTPLPPLAGCRGQRVDQTLLSRQAPFLDAVVRAAPPSLGTLVACGDVCLSPRRTGAVMTDAEATAALAQRLQTVLDGSSRGLGGDTRVAGSAGRTVHGIVPPGKAGPARSAEVDVVCLGVVEEAEALRKHGVFFMHESTPNDLAYMLQKPSPQQVHTHLAGGYTCLMDVGLWLLSARAVQLLRARSYTGPYDDTPSGQPARLRSYDLYSEFGYALGHRSHVQDPELNALTVKVVSLPEWGFHHFGTTRELVTSTLRMQADYTRAAPVLPGGSYGYGAAGLPSSPDSPASRAVQEPAPAVLESASDAVPLKVQAAEVDCCADTAAVPPWTSITHPTIIAQNALVCQTFSDAHTHIWVEGAYVGPRWQLHDHHVITGVPENDWDLNLPPGVCLAVVPVSAGRAHARQPPASHERPTCGRRAHDDGEDGPAAEAGLLYVGRPYGYDDSFTGSVSARPGAVGVVTAHYMGEPLEDWLRRRGLDSSCLLPAAAAAATTSATVTGECDLQSARLFPCLRSVAELGEVVAWMVRRPPTAGSSEADVDALRRCRARDLWLRAPRLSAEDLNEVADAEAMVAQRKWFQRRIYAVLADSRPPTARLTAAQQCFYDRVDLNAAAVRFARLGVHVPLTAAPLAAPQTAEGAVCGEHVTENTGGALSLSSEGGRWRAGAPPRSSSLTDLHRHMFYSCYLNERAALTGGVADMWTTTPTSGTTAPSPPLAVRFEAAAFDGLRTAMTHALVESEGLEQPRLAVLEDQIVWARSPARVDLCGGWTDTPPYSVLQGGSVVNMAVELNGQPPIQVYVKRHEGGPRIVLRSIDLGSETTITCFEEIRDFQCVGSAFAIPKAALALAGFLPEFCRTPYASLEEQLTACFGGKGLEVTLLVAIPAGSGLGTSSIVAGAVLCALGEFCGLAWDTSAACRRALILEQLLTTGGGWQDPYGGLFGGAKLIQSVGGLEQDPGVRWLPDRLFTDPRHRACHLLYYTGLTRTAKGILVDIVRGMFLHEAHRLEVLAAMRAQTQAMCDAITRGDFDAYGRLVGRAWELNMALDSGTCTAPVQALVDRVRPYVLGLKLAGAGGGGYMLLIARDEGCAARIREELTRHPPSPRARFVDMTLSATGIQVSRS